MSPSLYNFTQPSSCFRICTHPQIYRKNSPFGLSTSTNTPQNNPHSTSVLLATSATTQYGLIVRRYSLVLCSIDASYCAVGKRMNDSTTSDEHHGISRPQRGSHRQETRVLVGVPLEGTFQTRQSRSDEMGLLCATVDTWHTSSDPARGFPVARSQTG